MQVNHKKSSSSSSVKLQKHRVIIRSVLSESHVPEKTVLSANHKILLYNEDFTHTPDCLRGHNITEFQRARMINWMIEVTSTFNLSTRTIFISSKIMDKFFSLHNLSINGNLLHVIGLTSIFIASKYEDVIPLTMNDIVSAIGHNKIPKAEIIMTEQVICKKLGFFVNFITRCDFIEEISKEISLCEEAKNFALFLGRASMYFYSHMSLKESEVAFCCLFCAAKALKKEEAAIKVLSMSVTSKVYVKIENFKAELGRFKDTFPRLMNNVLFHQMDFDVIDGVVYAYVNNV